MPPPSAITETQVVDEKHVHFKTEASKPPPPPVEDLTIPYHVPTFLGPELTHVSAATRKPGLAGGGNYTNKVTAFLERGTKNSQVYLTTSCTRALEMAALLCDLKPGDEVIAPSFTFVSTINAFLLRGARIVFVDIEKDTMNLDHRLIEDAITDRTRVIVPVHYAGVGCDMDAIMEIAHKHNLLVVEDAAQCPMTKYKDRPLGSIGHIGCMSFHATKNYTAGGGGGAVFVNDPRFFDQADIVYDNGLNRRAFFRGEASSYEWKNIGSNFSLPETSAAYLWGQLDRADQINNRRRVIWQMYRDGLQPLAREGLLELMTVPPRRVHNAHIFFLKLADKTKRDAFGKFLKEKGVMTATHYTTLHDRDIAKKLNCRFHGEDRFTTRESDRLTRLPLYYEQTDKEVQQVLKTVLEFFEQEARRASQNDDADTNELGAMNGDGVDGEDK